MQRSTASRPAALLLDRVGPDLVTDRALDRHALAHDASHYLLVPEMVVRPTSAEQVGAVLRACDAVAAPVKLMRERESGQHMPAGAPGRQHVVAGRSRHGRLSRCGLRGMSLIIFACPKARNSPSPLVRLLRNGLRRVIATSRPISMQTAMVEDPP